MPGARSARSSASSARPAGPARRLASSRRTPRPRRRQARSATQLEQPVGRRARAAGAPPPSRRRTAWSRQPLVARSASGGLGRAPGGARRCARCTDRDRCCATASSHSAGGLDVRARRARRGRWRPGSTTSRSARSAIADVRGHAEALGAGPGVGDDRARGPGRTGTRRDQQHVVAVAGEPQREAAKMAASPTRSSVESRKAPQRLDRSGHPGHRAVDQVGEDEAA